MNKPQLTLRSLRGAPLSTLTALNKAHTPLQNKALVAWTGYSDKTIAAALDLLSGTGIVVSNGRYAGWSLTDQGRHFFHQLIFGKTAVSPPEGKDTAVSPPDDDPPAPPLPRSSAPPLPNSPTKPAPSSRNIPASLAPTRNFSGSPPSSSSLNKTMRKKRRQTTPPQPAAVKTAVFTLLRQAGVSVKMSRTLSQLAWVTPRYAQAHLDKAKRDEEPINYAIQRMREGDPPPVCRCGRCAACQEQALTRLGVADVVQR